MKRLITILCLFFLAASPAFCADFYVSTAGSDSNPGTQAQPFATIQHAIDACPYTGATSTVHLDGSTWNESPIMVANNISVSSNDRPDMTLIGDYNGPNGMGGMDQSIIIGTLTLEAYNGSPYSCVATASYLTSKTIYATPWNYTGNGSIVTIDHCKITHSSSDGIIASVEGDLSDINISNCIVYDCFNNGILYTNRTPDIHECQIYNNNEAGICGEDVQLSPHLPTHNINNNNIYDNGSYGLYLTNPKASFYNNQIVDNTNTGVFLTGNEIDFDMGGGAYDSVGNNTISGNGTYEVYNDSPNLIFAKYNYWDPLSYSEMEGHTYLEVNVTRIFDAWDDAGKGYVNWDEPGIYTRVTKKSLGEIRASFYPSSNTVGHTKAR